MREPFEERALGFAAGREYDFCDGSAADLTRWVKNRVAPSLFELGNDLRLTQHRVARLIRIEHDRPHVAQIVGDHTFAARNSANKAEDEHGARSQESGAGVNRMPPSLGQREYQPSTEPPVSRQRTSLRRRVFPAEHVRREETRGPIRRGFAAAAWSAIVRGRGGD